MSNQQQGSEQMTAAERKAAEKAATEKAEQAKAEQERQAVEHGSEGVELRRGDEVVTAYKPATVTRLKSEGWMPVEEENA